MTRSAIYFWTANKCIPGARFGIACIFHKEYAIFYALAVWEWCTANKKAETSSTAVHCAAYAYSANLNQQFFVFFRASALGFRLDVSRAKDRSFANFILDFRLVINEPQFIRKVKWGEGNLFIKKLSIL